MHLMMTNNNATSTDILNKKSVSLFVENAKNYVGLLYHAKSLHVLRRLVFSAG